MAVAAAACIGLVGTTSAFAGTFTYTPTEATNTSGSPDNWSAGTAAGWDATPVSATDTTLTLNGPLGAFNRFTANDVANPFQLNVLTLQATSTSATTGSLTLQGNALNFVNNGATAPTVNLNANKGTATSYSFAINNALTLSADTTFTGNGTATAFTFAGAITGAGGITKSGTSLLQLSSTSNAYGGTTNVSNGTLQLGAANVIPNGSAVNVSSTGLFSFNSKAETIASLSITGTGTVDKTAAAITISGAMTNSSTSGGGSGAAFVVNSGGVMTINGLATFNTGSQTLIGGGAGTRLNFNGGLSLTGATIRVNTGADSKITLASDVTVNDPGTTATSAIGNVTGEPNPLDLNAGNRTMTVANGSAAVDFSIVTLVANGSLTKAGLGTMALTNSGNSYAGGTTITSGSIAAQANSAFGAGNVTLSPGTTIDLSSTNVTSGAIADTATLSLASSGGTNFSTVQFGTNAISETVGSLLINGVSQSPGTYNSTNLGSYIIGSGNIVVAPEPASAGLLMLAATGLLVRRRRR